MTSDFIENIQCACIAIAADGTVIEANEAFQDMIGLHRVSGRIYSDLLLRQDRKRWTRIHAQLCSGSSTIEDHRFFSGACAILKFIAINRPDGSRFIAGMVLVLSETTIADGRKSVSPKHEDAFLLFEGISAARLRLEGRLKSMERQLEKALEESRTDYPTGLKNRLGLDQDIQNEITNDGAEGANLFLVTIDLDDFKQVNDCHGHHVGDRLLRAVGRRLRAAGDVVSAARIGGDEFAVLVRSELPTGQAFAEMLEQLRPRISKPFMIQGIRVNVSGSAGISVFGQDAIDPASALQNADAALLEAKSAGKDQIRLFDQSLSTKLHRKKVLEADLRTAVREDLLFPVYQPVISCREENVVGVEVLSRWDHPEFGSVPADEFIRLATDRGFLSELDLSVARAACQQLRPLFDSGQLQFVSFNLSPFEISRRDHIQAFISLIMCSGIPPHRICVEVTEADIITDFGAASAALQDLKAAGVHVALDDYGTGYSNLRALLDLPIDVIKIDRSLVADIATDKRAMQVVLSVINLARVLGAKLVAEGVENQEQIAVSQVLGCHYLQGFEIAKPMSAGDLLQWIMQFKHGVMPQALLGSMNAGKRLDLVG